MIPLSSLPENEPLYLSDVYRPFIYKSQASWQDVVAQKANCLYRNTQYTAAEKRNKKTPRPVLLLDRTAALYTVASMFPF